MRIHFLSAFEPPFSFYRDLLPLLADRGVEIDLLIGDVEYRKARKSLDEVISHTNVTIHRVPVVEVGSSNTPNKAAIYLCSKSFFPHIDGKNAGFEFLSFAASVFRYMGIHPEAHSRSTLLRSSYGPIS